MKPLKALVLLLLFAFTASAQSTITIKTANLQHGEGTDTVTNYSRQITKINEGSPDIVFVQERTTGDTGWNTPMASAGFSEAIWRENAPAPHQGDGSAIWFRTSTVTIVQTWSTDLFTGTNPGCGTPNVGNDCSTLVTKSAVAAKISYGGRLFYVVGTHLCWSLCNDPSATTSVQRENQIADLKAWVNTITGGSPNVIIGGDMNLAPDQPKIGGGVEKSLFTTIYTDLWNAGITASVASAPWGDRDGVGGADMPVSDLGTRTHDTRRIDYFFLNSGATNLTLNSITLPDSRATCSTTLTLTGSVKECPDVIQQWDVTDDQGVRVSDHNFLTVTLNVLGPTAVLNCPATAFVGEPVICDGTASTGVNGQQGWSTATFDNGTPPVTMDFGDSNGTYSNSTLLKATHVYLAAGSYTVHLTVKDSAGTTSQTTDTITISNIPAATGGNIIPLTDQGSDSANCSALQGAITTAFGANTVEKEITLPAIAYPCSLTFPASFGTKYVTIRPTNVSWLPGPLVRITPTLAGNMPKIQSAGTDQSPVTVSGANRGYIRFVGIEFSKPHSGHMYNFIQLGSGASTYAELPNHVMIDRCYLHGNTLDDTQRGVFVNADSFSILNSYLKDFHETGVEAQGISGFSGAGIAVVNNFIEAYTQGILFGGADTGIKFQTTASSTTSVSATLASVSNLRVGDGISFMISGVRGPWSASIVRSISGNNITFDQVTNQAGTPSAPDTTTNTVKYGSSPQDILIARNHFYKSHFYKCPGDPPCVPDPAYNGSYKPVVKNAFEEKHAMRTIFEGNIIENMWGNQGQSGPTVLFTPRNQTCYLQTFPHDPVTCPEQTNPWTMVRDVQFTNNRIMHIPDFINILGTDNLNPPGTGDESGPSALVQYIYVANNLIEDIDPDALQGSAGSVLWMFPGARHITFTHQTAINHSGGSPIGTEAAAIGETSLDVKLVNNIFEFRDFGFIGDGSQGSAWVNTFWPDGFVTHNVMSNEINSASPGDWFAPKAGPNYFPATIDTNTFVNRAAGNYRLAPTSPYKAGNATPGRDGLDSGVNFDTVIASTLNTVTGDWTGTGGSGSNKRGGTGGKVKMKGKTKIK